MADNKKYECNVGLYAEQDMTGVIYLTENEYKLVRHATNPENWEHVDGGGYCGSFCITCEELDAKYEAMINSMNSWTID